MALTSSLSSVLVMMRMAHVSCSPAIKEMIPHPLSPEYRVCMLREGKGRREVKEESWFFLSFSTASHPAVLSSNKPFLLP